MSWPYISLVQPGFSPSCSTIRQENEFLQFPEAPKTFYILSRKFLRKVGINGTDHIEPTHQTVYSLCPSTHDLLIWFQRFAFRQLKSWIKISLTVRMPHGTMFQVKKTQNCHNVKIIWQLYQYLKIEMICNTLTEAECKSYFCLFYAHSKTF